MTRLIVTATLFLLGGCGTSHIITDDTNPGAVYDGGVAILDASDNRNIPAVCYSDPECDDLDPCTVDTCVRGKCDFSLKDIALTSVQINASAPVVDVALASGYVYLATGDAGVEVFDIRYPENPSWIENIPTEGPAIAVDADERGIVVAEGSAGLESFSAPDFRQVRRLETGATDGESMLNDIEEVISTGLGPQYTIVGGYSNGVSVLSLANLGTPSLAGHIETSGRVVGAASQNDTHGLIADSLGGAIVIVFQTEEGPVIGGRVPSDGRVVDVSISGDTALLAEYGAGFSVVDISDPYHPRRLSIVVPSPANPSPLVSVSLLGPQTGVVAEQNGKISVYDFRDPFRPRKISTWQAGHNADKIDTHESLIAVALGSSGAALLQTACVTY